MPPRPSRSRWTSFSADAGEQRTRGLHEQGNPDREWAVGQAVTQRDAAEAAYEALYS